MSLPLAERRAKKRARQEARSKRRFARAYGSHAYVAAVVSHPCVVWQRRRQAETDCVYLRDRSEAAHVVKKTRTDIDLATWRGLVPLCTAHHVVQEGRSPEWFALTYGVDLPAEAARMVEAYGHLAEAQP